MDPIAVRNSCDPLFVNKSQLGQGVLAAPFYLQHYLMINGGWPRLDSEKRLWVPHPCGLFHARVGVLAFPLPGAAIRVSVPENPVHSALDRAS